jgi:hypothetical protein
VICGLMVPVHLRAIDDTVLAAAAHDTPSLLSHGLALAYGRNLGAAQMILKAAEQQRIPGREELAIAVTRLSQENSTLRRHGFRENGPVGALFEPESGSGSGAGVELVTGFMIRTSNRRDALAILERSGSGTVQQILRLRSATNTVLFPPASSASGQALDAAVATTGLLLEQQHLSAGLSNTLRVLAQQTAETGNTRALEQPLMDIMSLGQRLNWGQLVTFVGQVEDVETLRLQANLLRRAGPQLPILFAGVQLSANPAAVARYLTTYGSTGLSDLGSALRFGAGGVNELLLRNQRLHFSQFHPLFPGWSLRVRGLAMAIKWLMYLVGGILIAAAMHFAWPKVAPIERPLQVPGVHLAREFLFGLGFLLVVLLLSEPFLAQESQKVAFSLRLQLPTAGGAAPAGESNAESLFMNPEVLITMLVFFVLQALLYIACLVKLAEIRRQKVGARIKLRLLENEEHLFDSGLYLGFLGTIISLILVSLGVFKQPSLMAAYSATSFGILFVVIFKVMHLRPAKRRLLMEAESLATDPAAQTRPFAAPL